ncbi:MAG TPA: EamA family transporter [Polyangia bacterium]|jgi:drug/metabolite transporter (DMT)-like permease|nr:EamA family transporter [Polyangia bacterium]
MSPGGQIRRGVALAGLAALLFGMTAPLLKRASAGTRPLYAGALLYFGAALGALIMGLLRRRTSAGAGAFATRGLFVRLVVIALVGGAAAPALLVSGLERTDAATASLLLALEAPFTLLLAWILLREFIGRRVLLAAALIVAGGAALVGSVRASSGIPGPLLIAAAAFAWAVDNLLSRSLADQDPLRVVAFKGLFGGAASAVAGLVMRQAAPPLAAVAPLLALGAVGYGLSLQLYLRAQRVVGAARTASVFAAAPFAGMVVAFALGAPWPGPQLPIAAALIGAGLWLHLSERHAHRHRHAAITHEHLHRHDDGHHDHRHDPMPSEAHSHPHHHEPIAHEHEHSEDLHHRHSH